jgi:uncharacterized protein (UPF0335 family)
VNRNNAPQNSEALIERIYRLSDEAEWSTDELREVLIDAGIDPDQFVKDIKTRIKEVLKTSPERPEQNAQNDYGLLPLLPRLRRITGLKATTIAEKMGAPVTFISDLSSHPNVIPFRARREFARRAANNLPGVSERDVLDSFERGLHQQAAAFRDTPFPEEEVDFEKIVRRSDMSDEEQQYWLSLSQESPE